MTAAPRCFWANFPPFPLLGEGSAGSDRFFAQNGGGGVGGAG
jgi:hypothetical protein